MKCHSRLLIPLAAAFLIGCDSQAKKNPAPKAEPETVPAAAPDGTKPAPAAPAPSVAPEDSKPVDAAPAETPAAANQDDVKALEKFGSNVVTRNAESVVIGVNLHEFAADEGLKNLEGMKDLTELVLASTPITDAGLDTIKMLTKLKDINLSFSKVTPEGVSKLEAALPDAKITL
jgi:hypothetical protein